MRPYLLTLPQLAKAKVSPVRPYLLTLPQLANVSFQASCPAYCCIHNKHMHVNKLHSIPYQPHPSSCLRAYLPTCPPTRIRLSHLLTCGETRTPLPPPPARPITSLPHVQYTCMLPTPTQRGAGVGGVGSECAPTIKEATSAVQPVWRAGMKSIPWDVHLERGRAPGSNVHTGRGGTRHHLGPACGPAALNVVKGARPVPLPPPPLPRPPPAPTWSRSPGC